MSENMDWQRLKGFYHVARLGSFTQAGTVVHRTQSALSLQIKALESELGCTLFERIGKHSVALTPEGEALFDFASDLFLRQEKLIHALAEIRDHEQGRIRVAAAPTVMSLMLPELVRRFLDNHPHIRVNLYSRAPGDIFEQVKNGSLDIGISTEVTIPATVVAYRWQLAHLSLLLPKGHELIRGEVPPLEEIFGYPLIMPPNKLFASRKRYEESIEGLGMMPNILIELNDPISIVQYVKRGIGLGFMYIVEDCVPELEREVDVLPLDVHFKPEYLVIFHRRTQNNAHVSTFIENLLRPAVPGG